jgi:hypothetical protein
MNKYQSTNDDDNNKYTYNDNNNDDDDDNASEENGNFFLINKKKCVSSHLLSCIMIILNIFKCNNLKLFNFIDDLQFDKLTYVTFLMKILINDFSRIIIYKNTNNMIDTEEFELVANRLSELSSDLIKEQIVQLSEKYLNESLKDSFLVLCKDSLKEILLSSSSSSATTATPFKTLNDKNNTKKKEKKVLKRLRKHLYAL